MTPGTPFRSGAGWPDGDPRPRPGNAGRAQASGLRASVRRAAEDLPDQAPGDDDPTLDAGLRADVAHLLLDGLDEEEPLAVWLTRVGWPEPHDVDRLWLAAVLQACGERPHLPRWVAVVTKNGWYDPLHGDHVVWKRLRIR